MHTIASKGFKKLLTYFPRAFTFSKYDSIPPHNGICKIFQVKVVISIIWTVSISIALLPLIGFGSFSADVSNSKIQGSRLITVTVFRNVLSFLQTYMITCLVNTWSRKFTDMAFIVLLVTVGWFIPLVSIGLCYVNVSCSFFCGFQMPCVAKGIS